MDGDLSRLDRRWRRVGGAVLAIFAIAGAAAALIVWTTRSTDATPRGDPDPNGRILASLAGVESAVPPAASLGYVHRDEPHWDSCDGRAGTFGWSDVVVQLNFGAAENDAEIRRDVGRALQSAGWTPSAVDQWTLQTPSVGTARATLDHEPNGTWTVVAMAPPVGQRASGC